LREHSEWAGWVCIATDRLINLVPYGGHETKEVWVPYLPHAIYIVGCEDDVEDATRASLLHRVGRCQESLGQYALAEASHRQELSLRKEVLRPEHPYTLTSMSNVAGVLDS
jgi:lipoprotein NlpI